MGKRTNKSVELEFIAYLELLFEQDGITDKVFRDSPNKDPELKKEIFDLWKGVKPEKTTGFYNFTCWVIQEDMNFWAWLYSKLGSVNESAILELRERYEVEYKNWDYRKGLEEVITTTMFKEYSLFRKEELQ